MTTRKAARRHRGRMRPQPQRQATRPPRSEEERLEDVCEDAALETLKFWQARGEARFVYFVQAELGPIKIGRAQNPLGRLIELQCGNHCWLYLRAVVLGDDDAERTIHDHWADVWVRGEWFGNGQEEAILGSANRLAAQQMRDAQRGRRYDDIAVVCSGDLRSREEQGWRVA